jgi:uncharacterized membrane protein YkvA (DUF1232 family)
MTDIPREKHNKKQHACMKPKSTEPLINSSKLSTAQFGQVSPSAWRISGKTMTIDEYIEDQGKDVNSTDLRVLGTFTGRMLDKLKEANADDYPGLREAVHAIVRVLESSVAQQAKDPLPTWLAEIGFAGGYLLKRYDLVPDHLPEIGLADDALILGRVIDRNRSELCRSLVAETDSTADDSG